MIRNVIFDWSGTLVDDLPAVLEATNHVLVQAGQPPLSRDRFRAEFKLPFTGFYERYTPSVPMAQLETWFHGRFREVQHSVTELPHAREFLEFCRARGLRTLLLSTMAPEHFEVQTRANGFQAFIDHPYLGVWDKRTMIREILQAHGLEPAETIFIGDMEHDVETARHGGIGSVAVLTGYTGVAALRAASPDLIVEHLGELQRLLERQDLHLHPPAPPPGRVAPPRLPIVTVGAAIFDEADQLLLVRTHKWSNRWGIPGGKVKFGESSEAALERELLEETGLPVRDIRFAMVQDCIGSKEFYRDEHFVLLNYVCRAEGRGPEVRLNDEAQEFQWTPMADALAFDLNVPTRRLLEHLIATAAPSASSRGSRSLPLQTASAPATACRI